MILFQDNKEKQGESPSGILENFKDIKSVGSLPVEKVKVFWDELFGSKDTYKPDNNENYLAEVFGRTSDEFQFDFDIGYELQGDLEKFKSPFWGIISDGEKTATIKEFASALSEKLNIENPPRIEFFEGPRDSCGAYCYGTNTISINRALFDDTAEVVDTIAHETWHAYQHQRADTMETRKDYLYKLNFDNYISPITLGDGKYLFFTDYQEQLVEAEATAFANIFREEVAV